MFNNPEKINTTSLFATAIVAVISLIIKFITIDFTFYNFGLEIISIGVTLLYLLFVFIQKGNDLIAALALLVVYICFLVFGILSFFTDEPYNSLFISIAILIVSLYRLYMHQKMKKKSTS